jgi:hypothetical protein
MKHIKLFEGFADDNERIRIYNKLTYSPSEITIELTQRGKESIEENLKGWLKQSTPSNQTGGYIPRTRISVKDKVSIKASYYGGANDSGRGDKEINRGKMVDIGEIMIDEEPWSGRRWTSDSPLTKTGEDDGKHSSGSFIIFARYFPLGDKGGKGATISLTKSIRKEEQWSEKANPMQKVTDCAFDKVEVGQIDDRGYFKIVDIN